MTHGCWTCRKSRPLRRSLARPGIGFFLKILGSPCRKRTLFLVGKRGQHRFAPYCLQMCSVSGQKHVHPKASASRSEYYSSRHHTRFSVCLSLAMILTMNAPRFQRTHLLSGVGSSPNASKDTGMGITDITPISAPVIDGGYTAVVGSVCPFVFEAGSGCKDRSSDVCSVGDTRLSVSENDDVIIRGSCLLTSCLIATCSFVKKGDGHLFPISVEKRRSLLFEREGKRSRFQRREGNVSLWGPVSLCFTRRRYGLYGLSLSCSLLWEGKVSLSFRNGRKVYLFSRRERKVRCPFFFFSFQEEHRRTEGVVSLSLYEGRKRLSLGWEGMEVFLLQERKGSLFSQL